MNNLQGKNALKEISVYLQVKIMTVYTQAPDLQC